MYGDWTGYYPQGWICPVCKHVYSPNTTMCMYCGNRNVVITNTTEPKKEDGIIRKIMVGDTPETMKQIVTDGEW